jgi:hypothetical protein
MVIPNYAGECGKIKKNIELKDSNSHKSVLKVYMLILKENFTYNLRDVITKIL